MNGLIEVSTKGTYTNLLQLFTGTAYIAIPEIEWRGDPFQDAAPCFHPDWQLPTAKEIKPAKLAADQEYRESIKYQSLESNKVAEEFQAYVQHWSGCRVNFPDWTCSCGLLQLRKKYLVK